LKLAALAGWIPFTSYDLRQCHATWLLAAGVPITAVRDRLGHANIAVTLMHLQYLDDGLMNEALSKLFDTATERLNGARRC
jgi:integrase